MLTKKKVANKIWAIYSDTQSEIGKAFVRFQEYYENADLKGRKDLTVQLIERWWKKTKEEDEEDYYDHWVGFNLPGHVIVQLALSPQFRTGFSFSELLTNPQHYPRWHKEEDALLALFDDLPVPEIVESYFIGLWKGSTDVLEHEVAHGLFTTNPAYKSEQLYNLSRLPTNVYEGIRKNLLSCGYHPHVIHDEMQAYLGTYVDTLEEKFETNEYNKYTAPFENTFKTFYCPRNSADSECLASNEEVAGSNPAEGTTPERDLTLIEDIEGWFMDDNNEWNYNPPDLGPCKGCQHPHSEHWWPENFPTSIICHVEGCKCEDYT